MTPVWSPEAISDLAALRAYIEQDDPAAAQRVALHIVRNIETLLPNNPEMGRPGRVPGTRELVIPETPFDSVEKPSRSFASSKGFVDGPENFEELPRHGNRPAAFPLKALPMK